MSVYVESIVAVTLACAVMMMLTEGGRFERVASSASCVAIALCVILPLRGVAQSAGEGFKLNDEIYERAESAVVADCTEALGGYVADALRERFDGIEVVRAELETDDEDIKNITVTKATAWEHGAPCDEVEEYLAELLMCRDVTVRDTGGG